MQITKQLAIFLDNRPGTLARVADAFAEAKINIYAITTSDTVDHSVIRMVVSDYRRALHLFEEHSTLMVEDDVLMIEGSNKPGELARTHAGHAVRTARDPPGRGMGQAPARMELPALGDSVLQLTGRPGQRCCCSHAGHAVRTARDPPGRGMGQAPARMELPALGDSVLQLTGRQIGRASCRERV